MKVCKSLTLVSFVLSLFFMSCDTPKSLTNKAQKLTQKSLYLEACQHYMLALNKDKQFSAAKIGLREAGQKQINLHLDDFFKAKNFGDKRKAIYFYRDADALHSKIGTYDVRTDIPINYTQDYNDLVDDYVSTIYSEAMDFLEQEQFQKSETLLKEINVLKPNYKDVAELKDVATFEPIYRKANDFLELEKFRSAYYQFDRIPNSYKECQLRKALALEAGLMTIGLVNFENASLQKGSESAISALIVDELMKLNNPFIKIVDRQFTQTFIDEQIMGLSGQVAENTNAQAGELIGAKAILSGKVVSFSKQQKAIEKTTKKGWLEKSVRKYDTENEKYYYETVYDKIRYDEFQGSTSVQLGFQFRLISTETGEILLTKLINLSKNDQVHYANANVNTNKIVPGNWRWENKDSPNDVINDSYSEKRALKALFSAKRNLLSVNELANLLYLEIAKDVSQKINNYNPENE